VSETRTESGPVRIGDDWAGVFIRGDRAFAYALALDAVLEASSGDLDVAIDRLNLRALMDLLTSCTGPCTDAAVLLAAPPTTANPTPEDR
jgi:hypothetical protein